MNVQNRQYLHLPLPLDSTSSSMLALHYINDHGSFAIAETEGIDRVTIRKVAEQLGSSIAPIYVNFTDVEALKQAVASPVIQSVVPITKFSSAFLYVSKS